MTNKTSTETKSDETLATHLHRLSADADDIVAMLTLTHREDGDIHPRPSPRLNDFRRGSTMSYPPLATTSTWR